MGILQAISPAAAIARLSGGMSRGGDGGGLDGGTVGGEWEFNCANGPEDGAARDAGVGEGRERALSSMGMLPAISPPPSPG